MDLQKLIDDRDVLYIYEIGLQIHGLFDNSEDRDFLLVVSDDYIPSKELEDDEHFQVYYISNWFNRII